MLRVFLVLALAEQLGIADDTLWLYSWQLPNNSE